MVKFNGPLDRKFLAKYRVSVYKKDIDRNKNELIIGSISNDKLRNQRNSDFEKFKNDVLNYANNDALKSYFNKVKSIQPLTLNEIIEKDLKKKFKNNPSQDFFVDVSFAGKKNDLDQKLSSIEGELEDKLISKINTERLHYCRLKVNFQDVKEIVKKYDEIIRINQAPKYELMLSAMRDDISHLKVNPPQNENRPVIIFDGPVNKEHVLLDRAVKDCIGSNSGDMWHGTAVASLVIAGMQLNNNQEIQQENHVISANVLEDNPFKLDERIADIVPRLAAEYQQLIINLSINNYTTYFGGVKTIHNLTALLDELANKYNCIFVVSVGNLFQFWEDEFVEACKRVGYPSHFAFKFSRILPPADSINNISVGSVTYQESVDSITRIKHPAPHTRGNVDDSPFIKPDFVHYDSNFKKDFTPEYNGITTASDVNNEIIKSYGTSFSTPLITHELAKLSGQYPNYSCNTLKALLVHFSDNIDASEIGDLTMKSSLVGFGMPNMERAVNSLSNSTTIVIEDEIKIGTTKTIKFPIPSCISGSHLKRLRIRKTLVYNPITNPSNPRLYNPINISAQLLRDDRKAQGGLSTRETYGGAHQKSNVKNYPTKEFSTTNHAGKFWYIDVVCELKDEDFTIAGDYRQKYSIVLTIEDMFEDDTIDLHEEIESMIEIESRVSVPIDVNS